MLYESLRRLLGNTHPGKPISSDLGGFL